MLMIVATWGCGRRASPPGRSRERVCHATAWQSSWVGPRRVEGRARAGVPGGGSPRPLWHDVPRGGLIRRARRACAAWRTGDGPRAPPSVSYERDYLGNQNALSCMKVRRCWGLSSGSISRHRRHDASRATSWGSLTRYPREKPCASACICGVGTRSRPTPGTRLAAHPPGRSRCQPGTIARPSVVCDDFGGGTSPPPAVSGR